MTLPDNGVLSAPFSLHPYPIKGRLYLIDERGFDTLLNDKQLARKHPSIAERIGEFSAHTAMDFGSNELAIVVKVGWDRSIEEILSEMAHEALHAVTMTFHRINAAAIESKNDETAAYLLGHIMRRLSGIYLYDCIGIPKKLAPILTADLVRLRFNTAPYDRTGKAFWFNAAGALQLRADPWLSKNAPGLLKLVGAEYAAAAGRREDTGDLLCVIYTGLPESHWPAHIVSNVVHEALHLTTLTFDYIGTEPIQFGNCETAAYYLQSLVRQIIRPYAQLLESNKKQRGSCTET